MKGAKGGNRDRIISWLFSERTRKKREEELELEKIEENKIDEKRKERRKSKKNDTDTNLEHVEELEVSQKDEEVLSTIPLLNNLKIKVKKKLKIEKIINNI